MITEEEYLKAKQIVQEYEKQLNISDVIHRISWVYFVGERHLYKRDENPKMFLDEELSKKYWEEIGKDKYTWWRGAIYGV